MPKLIPDADGQIKRAARNLLLTKGYSGFSIKEIARQTGIAAGTIYQHYPNKRVLMNEVMQEDWDRILSQVDEAMATSPDISSCLVKTFDLVVEFNRSFKAVRAQYAAAHPSRNMAMSHHQLIFNLFEPRIMTLLKRFGKDADAAMGDLLTEVIVSGAFNDRITSSQVELLTRRLFPQG